MINTETQRTLLSLTTNDNGYSVIDCVSMTKKTNKIVKDHICTALGIPFESLENAATYLINNCFTDFKDKKSRILPKQFFLRLKREMVKQFDFCESSGDLVTDEEDLHFGNAYWRLVRKNRPSDVGPIHADRWFWDLGHGSIPLGYTRIKVWMPLLQDDQNPSLLVLPGSHKQQFTYSHRTDESGKRKPVFHDPSVAVRMISAPVKVGQAMVFHDSLLHGGKTTTCDRISLEWTFAICDSTPKNQYTLKRQ